MGKDYWKRWLKAASIRAIKTIAQTAVATIGTAAVIGEVKWTMVISAALLAGIIFFREKLSLTQIAGFLLGAGSIFLMKVQF